MERARVAGIPLFANLPPAELDAIADAASEIEVGDGEALTTEGEFGHALFAIEAGSADISIGGKRVGTAGSGDIVGEVAVLASGRRTASVIATSPLRALVLFKRDVWALERRAPEAAGRIRTALEQHRVAAPPSS
jgi:CRP-like cAMP-binding protein